jgi:hypothetical protein
VLLGSMYLDFKIYLIFAMSTRNRCDSADQTLLPEWTDWHCEVVPPHTVLEGSRTRTSREVRSMSLAHFNL